MGSQINLKSDRGFLFFSIEVWGIILIVLISLFLILSLFDFSKAYLIFHILSQKRIYLLFILVILIFIEASYLYYNYKIKPTLNKAYIANKEFIPQGKGTSSKSATLYLYYTTWCPYCKQIKKNSPDSNDNSTDGAWSKLINYISVDNKNKINGVEIKFVEIDCDAEPLAASQFPGPVEEYPTIKMVYNKKLYNFQAKPTFKRLKDFVNEVL